MAATERRCNIHGQMCTATRHNKCRSLTDRHHPAIIIIGSTPTRAQRLPAKPQPPPLHCTHAPRITHRLHFFTFLAAANPLYPTLIKRTWQRLSIWPQFGLVQCRVHAALRVWVPRPQPTLARDVTEHCVCVCYDVVFYPLLMRARISVLPSRMIKT